MSEEEKKEQKDSQEQKQEKKGIYISKKLLVGVVVLVLGMLVGFFLIDVASFTKTSINSEKLHTDKEKAKQDSQQKEELPAIIEEKGQNFFQLTLVDLDGDGMDEGVVLSHDDGKGIDQYETKLLIYSYKNSAWQKVIEKKLEPFSLINARMDASGYAETVADIAASKDFNGDGIKEIVISTIEEIEAQYMSMYVYGLKNGKISLLHSKEEIPHGKVGSENDLLWTIHAVYKIGYKDCCPDAYLKRWWQWQDNDFELIGEKQSEDFNELKNSKYSESYKIASYPDGVNKEQAKQIAFDYMAGKLVLQAAPFINPDEISKTSETPASIKYEYMTIPYDPVRDEYIPLIEREESEKEARKVDKDLIVVILDYQVMPYHAEIQIDKENGKIAGWWMGQR